MKKQIPILFSTSMVQAILAGRKTMTRRVIKWPTVPEWHDWDYEPNTVTRPKGGMWWPEYHHRNGSKDISGPLTCPYGQPGDILYVREEYYQHGWWGYCDRLTKGGKTKREFIPTDDDITFENTITAGGQTFKLEMGKRSSMHSGWFKRLARFMPKKYARIWLVVTGIRVERLHEINGDDVRREGAGEEVRQMWLYGLDQNGRDEVYRRSFERLWIKINGQDSWEANPWVWVVSFRVLSTTGKPADLTLNKTP